MASPGSDGIQPDPTVPGMLVKIVSSQEHRIEVVKRFPVEEFGLRVANKTGGEEMIEWIPRSLLLTHIPSGGRLQIPLDLFEVLGRLADGLDPASAELKPYLEELEPFKYRVQLARVDEVIVRSGAMVDRLRHEGDRIIRESSESATGGAR